MKLALNQSLISEQSLLAVETAGVQSAGRTVDLGGEKLAHSP